MATTKVTGHSPYLVFDGNAYTITSFQVETFGDTPFTHRCTWTIKGDGAHPMGVKVGAPVELKIFLESGPDSKPAGKIKEVNGKDVKELLAKVGDDRVLFLSENNWLYLG